MARQKNITVPTNDLPWEPWDRYFPGAPPNEGDFGGWVKVLRKPDSEQKGWAFLFKWVGWPGKKVRVIAVVPDDSVEEVFNLNSEHGAGEDSAIAGDYIYRGRGAPHGSDFGADFVSFLRYDGEPDIIKSYKFLDR